MYMEFKAHPLPGHYAQHDTAILCVYVVLYSTSCYYTTTTH